MQVDEVIWSVINYHHCSFKRKTEAQNFCRNQYNVSGLCSKGSCPLANGQYATVREEKGICYLYMKTVERAHTPDKLWEKVRLDKNYNKALQQIEEQLADWQPFLIHKCKQRLTKLRQMLIRMRKMKLQGEEEVVPVKKKAERRDKIREAKALRASHLELQIEQELLERLKNGVYQDIYNLNQKAFNKAVQQIGSQEEEEELLEDEREAQSYLSQSEEGEAEADLNF